MLYIIPTPIGNLKDITVRALDVLKEVDLILAEDTRQTKKLLNHYEITTAIDSLHQHNEHKKVESIVDKLSAGITIAQVSDAGTPGISDPGFLLIRECLKHNIRVECLPGATAFVPALVKSGLPCEKFVFEGFLPHKKGRQTRLKELATETRTIVFYESPYRLVKTLKQIAEFIAPERQVSVSRELTKIYEETKNGTVTEVANYFEQKGVKGEIVIILKGLE
jgi:16S rRNA (cytidine1402-2'-O)-methyltransferase